jgi:hypothetical protein
MPLLTTMNRTGRRYCAAEARVLVEALHPSRVISRTIGENRGFRQPAAQVVHDLAQIEPARHGAVKEIFEIVIARLMRPVPPAGRIHRRQSGDRLGEFQHARVHHQVGLIDTAKFIHPGMYMHEALLRPGY